MLTKLIAHTLRMRRRAAERMGIERYSRPSLNDLDRKLGRHLPSVPGVFIEAGANDGYAQSNTYYLERIKGWRGLLVEPIPELFTRCRQERPNSIVVQAALVAPDHPEPTIEMTYAGLMSVSANAFGGGAKRDQHIEVGLLHAGLAAPYCVRVPARTLSSLIEEYLSDTEIDLLSIDVEGSENEALRGLNIDRHAPRFICIEARDVGCVTKRLSSKYHFLETLSDNGSHCDLLFKRR